MCGRLGLDASWAELVEYFNLLRPVRINSEFAPRYNTAPTQPVVMAMNGPDGAREGLHVRWGFLPSWAKDPKKFSLIINARSETAIEKPSFRSAMRHRRTLVPASGFFEWQRFGKGQKSQPWWVTPKQGKLMAFGGLMETWADPNGSEIDTGCIITTAANRSFSAIHHRLPLIIHPRDFDQWLDCKTQEPEDVAHLMQPVEDGFLDWVPVSDLVNKVSNTGAELIAPLDEGKVLKSPENDSSTASKDDGAPDDQMQLF